MSPEVLIYVQKIKDFFIKDEQVRSYFIGDTNEDVFFEKVYNISQENFDKNGEAMLSREQFEELKFSVQKNKIIENIYHDLGGFGKICLN
jgi:hypothetical protein